MPFRRYSQLESEPRRALKEPITILIVYEDCMTGLLGKELFNRVADRLGPDYDIHWTLWRFDVLGIPALKAETVCDANMADLVVISSYENRPLPAAVEQWMEWWERQEARPDGRLVVALLVSSDSDLRTDGGRLPRLEQLAQRCRREFLAKEVDPHRLGRDLLLKKLLEMARQTGFLIESKSRRLAMSGRPSGLGP
jgi:hypothetical protein